MSKAIQRSARQCTIETQHVIQRISRQFEAAGLNSGLIGCTLTYQGERADAQELPRPDLSKYPFVSGTMCVPNPTPSSPRVLLNYVGETKDITGFLRYAGEAGGALVKLPQALTRSLGIDHLFVQNDAMRWVYTLYDLAWVEPRLVRYAARKEVVWQGTRFPHDSAQLTAMLNIGTWSPSTPEKLVKWSKELPDWFVSDIQDLWSASLSAVDVILSNAAAESVQPQSAADEVSLTEAAEKWDVPKPAWTKAANRPPDAPGYLPTRKLGRNRFVTLSHARQFATNYIARREQRLRAPATQFPLAATPRKRAKEK